MFSKALRRVGVELICLWLKTFRIHFLSPIPKGVVFGLWHQDLPACMAAFRYREIAVMISASHDGDWASMVAQRLGYQVVRGSGSRKGESVRHLVFALRKGRNVGMALDGPRGPALQEKPGAEWLSQQSGSPLVKLHLEAFPAFRVRSWDRTIVPLPFATIRVQFLS